MKLVSRYHNESLMSKTKRLALKSNGLTAYLGLTVDVPPQKRTLPSGSFTAPKPAGKSNIRSEVASVVSEANEPYLIWLRF